MTKEEMLIQQIKELAYMVDELKGWNHTFEIECTTCLNTGERLTRNGFEPYCHCSLGADARDEDEYLETIKAEWV